MSTDFYFKNLILLLFIAPVGCLQFYYNPTGIVKSFNFIDNATLPSNDPNSIIQKTIQDITYAICFPVACRVEFGLYEPGYYFYMYSTYSAANNDSSANGNQCDSAKFSIPTNAKNIAQPKSYCGGHLNTKSGKQTDEVIEYYLKCRNRFEVSFGPQYHPRNGFYLYYALTDCNPTPTTSEFS